MTITILLTILLIIALAVLGQLLWFIGGKIFNPDGWLNLYVLYTPNERKMLRFLSESSFLDDRPLYLFHNHSRLELSIEFVSGKRNDSIVIREIFGESDEPLMTLDAFNFKPFGVAAQILQDKIDDVEYRRLINKRKRSCEEVNSSIGKILK